MKRNPVRRPQSARKNETERFCREAPDGSDLPGLIDREIANGVIRMLRTFGGRYDELIRVVNESMEIGRPASPVPLSTPDTFLFIWGMTFGIRCANNEVDHQPFAHLSDPAVRAFLKRVEITMSKLFSILGRNVGTSFLEFANDVVLGSGAKDFMADADQMAEFDKTEKDVNDRYSEHMKGVLRAVEETFNAISGVIRKADNGKHVQ